MKDFFPNPIEQKTIVEAEKDPLEGKILSFEANETKILNKRSSNMEIEKVVSTIYQGNEEGLAGYAKRVIEVDARVVLEDGEKSPPHRFVLKELKEEGDTENLLKRHGELVAAGLPTWNTLRINPEHKIALMTSGNQEGKTVIMPNNANDAEIPRLAETKGAKVENFRELIDNMCNTAIKAGQNDIKINDDVWTYFLDNQAITEDRPFEMSYTLGDLDEITSTERRVNESIFKTKKKNPWNQLGRINLNDLKVSFEHLSRYLSPDSRESFLQYAESRIEELKRGLSQDESEDV